MAGKINPQWLADARSNETPPETLEEWVKRCQHCEVAEIDNEGSVWIQGPQAGHWMSQEAIDSMCAAIDAGV